MGTFKVESGKIMVSDPCYKEDNGFNCVLENVKNGNWIAILEYDERERVSKIGVFHDLFANLDCLKWHPFNEMIGVDSGQAGIFDADYYRDDGFMKHQLETGKISYINPDRKICEDKPWYSICCDRTLGDEGAGVIPFGFVSSSGYGDGEYIGMYGENEKGEIVSVLIHFIDDVDSQDVDDVDSQDVMDYSDEEDFG